MLLIVLQTTKKIQIHLTKKQLKAKNREWNGKYSNFIYPDVDPIDSSKIKNQRKNVGSEKHTKKKHSSFSIKLLKMRIIVLKKSSLMWIISWFKRLKNAMYTNRNLKKLRLVKPCFWQSFWWTNKVNNLQERMAMFHHVSHIHLAN